MGFFVPASFLPGSKGTCGVNSPSQRARGKRAQAANELQKALESANIKLQSVVTDITGASSMEMLQALTSGKNNPKELAQLAKRRLRAKIPELEKALRGNLRRHHQMILEQLLADIGLFAAQIAQLDAYIENLLRQEQEIIDRLDDTPESTGVLPKSLLPRQGPT